MKQGFKCPHCQETTIHMYEVVVQTGEGASTRYLGMLTTKKFDALATCPRHSKEFVVPVEVTGDIKGISLHYAGDSDQ